jgi:glyoxylate/hydroxypyruvate reductase A
MSDKLRLVFYSQFDEPEDWRRILAERAPWVEFLVWPDVPEPDKVDVALVYRAPLGFFPTFPNLRAVLSLAAGVDGLLDHAELPQIPVARMVDPGLTQTMAEYVLGAVLHLHRGFSGFARDQRAGRWDYVPPPATKDRRVGFLGRGVLGSASAALLASQGFSVMTWSRSPGELPGVTSFTGAHELCAMLEKTDILVCLLPLTPSTRGILNLDLMNLLPRGAMLINVGRGAHLVEEDLLTLLADGHISDAILDVFAQEPPPPGHAFWTHPRILMTPHVASFSSPDSAAGSVVANLERIRAGEPLLDQARE